MTKLLLALGAGDIVICDRAGAVYQGRESNMDFSKLEIAALTNRERRSGQLADIVAGSDIFIGLSVGGALTPEMVKSMAANPIVLALANPVPEIAPELAKSAGALCVATGRSDYPNQVNNSLAFPGVFRGVLDCRARVVNDEMKIAAAYAIAELVADEDLTVDYIIPDSIDLRVPPKVAAAVARAATRDWRGQIGDRPGRRRGPLPRSCLRGFAALDRILEILPVVASDVVPFFHPTLPARQTVGQIGQSRYDRPILFRKNVIWSRSHMKWAAIPQISGRGECSTRSGYIDHLTTSTFGSRVPVLSNCPIRLFLIRPYNRDRAVKTLGETSLREFCPARVR